MADINLQEIHDDLKVIAFEAAAIIMAANPNSISTGTKLNCKDHSSTIAHSSPDSSIDQPLLTPFL